MAGGGRGAAVRTVVPLFLLTAAASCGGACSSRTGFVSNSPLFSSQPGRLATCNALVQTTNRNSPSRSRLGLLCLAATAPGEEGEGKRRVWEVRRAGESRSVPSQGATSGYQHVQALTGAEDGGVDAPAEAREGGSRQRVAKGDRDREDGNGRPTRDQIGLNQRLSQLCVTDDVLREVDEARVSGVDPNIVNFATALSKIAKSQPQGGNGATGQILKDSRFTWILSALQGKIRRASGRLDPRSIASLAWSLASLRVPGTDSILSIMLDKMTGEDLEDMKARALSTIAWAVAKRSTQLGETLTDQVLSAVSRECERRGPEMVSSQDVSNLVWAFATMRVYSRGILNLVDGAVGFKGSGMGEWSAQSLSNVMWGLAKLGVKRCAASDAIASEAAKRSLVGFSSQELSNLVWGATVAQGRISPALAESVESWLASNTFVKPQHLTVTLWCFAKGGVSSPLLYRHAEDVVVGSVSGLADFRPQAISNLVWAFATVGRESKPTFAAVEEAIFERRLDEFKPQEVANLAWSFSKACLDGGFNEEAPGILWTCVEETMSCRGMDSFDPAHVSMLAWACARKMKRLMAPPGRFVGRSGSRERSVSPRTLSRDAVLASVMSMIAANIKERGLGGFKPHELSILAWSFATTGGLACPQVLADLVVEFQERDLSFFSSQGLTNMAWAYAHWLQGPNNLVTGLFSNIDAEIQRRGLPSMRVAETAVVAWAFAKTGQKDAGLLSLLLDRMSVETTLEAYNEQNLVMCLWSLSATDHTSVPLLDRIEGEMLDRGLEAFKAREINAAVFALSKAKHASQRLWDAIDAEAGERARSVERYEVGETIRDYTLDASLGGEYHESSGADMGFDQGSELAEEDRGDSSDSRGRPLQRK